MYIIIQIWYLSSDILVYVDEVNAQTLGAILPKNQVEPLKVVW